MTTLENTFILDDTDLTYREIPVGSINGTNYILKEPTEAVVVEYENAEQQTIRMSQGEYIEMRDTANLRALLVSKCLFRKPDEKTTESVSVEFVKKFKTEKVRKLYEMCIELGGIDNNLNLESLKKQRDKLDKRIKKMEEKNEKNS